MELVISYPGPPKHGHWNVNDVATDSNGASWYCSVAGKADSGGTAVFVSAGGTGTFVPLSSVGAASGVAGLDSNGLVPIAQLPVSPVVPVSLFGAGVPSNTLGLNGQYYLNTTTQDVYGPKAAGAWGSVVFTLKKDIGRTQWCPPLLGGMTTVALTANRQYLTICPIEEACTLTGIAVENGGTAAGNMLAAIYSPDGTTLLASSASTAQAGTTVQQRIPFQATVAVAPGLYVLSLIPSGSVGTNSICYPITNTAFTALGSFATPSSCTPPTGSVLNSNPPVMATY